MSTTPWSIIGEWRELAVRDLHDRESIPWREADERTPDPRPEIKAMVDSLQAKSERLEAEAERLLTILDTVSAHPNARFNVAAVKRGEPTIREFILARTQDDVPCANCGGPEDMHPVSINGPNGQLRCSRFRAKESP